jgi:hypothetical protein
MQQALRAAESAERLGGRMVVLELLLGVFEAMMDDLRVHVLALCKPDGHEFALG